MGDKAYSIDLLTEVWAFVRPRAGVVDLAAWAGILGLMWFVAAR